MSITTTANATLSMRRGFASSLKRCRIAEGDPNNHWTAMPTNRVCWQGAPWAHVQGRIARGDTHEVVPADGGWWHTAAAAVRIGHGGESDFKRGYRR
jgi:hypothetical protein